MTAKAVQEDVQMEMESIALSCIEGPQSCEVSGAELVELHVGQHAGWAVYRQNSQTLCWRK